MDKKKFNKNNMETVIEKWKFEGEKIPLGQVPYHILRLVSRYFPPQDDWKRFASYLGIDTIQTLTEIEGDAQVCKEWPSLLAMNCAAKSSSRSPTFADLIDILQTKLVRLDALQKLHDSGEVEAFLVIKKCDEEVHLYEDKQRLTKILNNEISCDELDAVVKQLALKNTNKFKNLTSTKNVVPTSTVIQANACTVEMTVSTKCERESVTTKKKDTNNIDDEKSNKSVPVVVTRPNLPKKPVILLTYSSDVNDIIPKLVERFWDAGIGVVSNYTLDGKGVLESNPIAIWECLFKQCNFVIPVISDKYLEDIHRPDDDCDQGQIVRFIHDMYVNKYVEDGCMNRIVRSLVVSDVNTRKLRSVNPTLRCRYVLWKGLETVINIVKDDFNARIQRTMQK